MVDTSFEATYPEDIVAKYSTSVRPASVSNGHRAVYVGPAVRTIIRAVGVQHFSVLAEPEDVILDEFVSKNGMEAFVSAVRLAEQRGLPWKDSGGADIFDPATGGRWTYRAEGVLLSAFSVEVRYRTNSGCNTKLFPRIEAGTAEAAIEGAVRQVRQQRGVIRIDGGHAIPVPSQPATQSPQAVRKKSRGLGM